MYQPKTGEKCYCRKGTQRDNCITCEGTGMRIDFKKIRNHCKDGRCKCLNFKLNGTPIIEVK
jgi:hypothetical protein